MTMTPARWQEVKALFDQALERPEAERGDWLRRTARDDLDLRLEVESLLTALAEESGRFERPAAASLGRGAEAEPGPGHPPGSHIGPYRVVQEIGRGGMGVVFEAFRDDDQFRKRVALKTISRGMDSDLILRRFRYERQILAGLEHKNIATLLDGGVTEEGQPYFALEYVEGSPIDRYCDERQLELPARLSLFRQVCGAVQYAHTSLVIHRDLKPSNILVTADGTVKLLDFGIAKLLRQDAGGEGEGLTQPDMLPLTVAYASPEQLRGEPVTTATDVYSLGVVLYKLLSGRHPAAYDAPGGAELRRRILEEAPPPPSVAAAADPRRHRALRGELDSIALMALRKEPERRYASAERLADDLQRFLTGRPVAAQPDSSGYRLRKFVQRNRTAVAAGVIALVALVAGLGTTAWQARVARRERDRARVAAEAALREQARTSRITLFLQNMLGAADPSWYAATERPGPATTIGEIFDGAARRAETELADEPQVLAEVLRTLGTANQVLRRLPLAKEQLTRARDIHLRLEGAGSLNAARDEHELGVALLHAGELREAERLLNESLSRYRLVGDTTSDDFFRTVANLGLVFANAGRPADAERQFRVAAEHYRDSTGVVGAILLGNFGLVLSQQGKLDSAEPVYRKALAMFDRLPRDYFEKGWSLGNLAVDFILRGRPREALPLAEAQIAHFSRLLSPSHPTVGYGWVNLARSLHALGREEEALRAARRAEALFKGAHYPADHPDFARTEYIQGLIFASTNRRAEAERRLRNALAIRRSRLAPGSMHTTDVEFGLGALLAETRRFAEAESLLTAAYRTYRRGLDPGDPRIGQARRGLVKLCDAGWPPACGYRDSLPTQDR